MPMLGLLPSKLSIARRLLLAVLTPVAISSTQVTFAACQQVWLPGSRIDGSIDALVVFDDGSGSALYAGGRFMHAGGVPASRIARWDGRSWSPLGTGIRGYNNDSIGEVLALAVFDDGTGPALYAGGYFPVAGGYLAYGIAKWDGASWSPLRSFENGTIYFGIPELVFALTVYDDGSGLALYVGGAFHGAGGTKARSIVKWDGAAWSPLGAGLEGDYPEVRALAVFDDGGGPALYAAGKFSLAGGISANNIAKWDGKSWSPLGAGVGNAYYPVEVLSVFDDGGGPRLYAGGKFYSDSDGVHVLSSWDGSTWTVRVHVQPITYFPTVYSLSVYNDGTGYALYAGGSLLGGTDFNANGIAKWNGQNWAVMPDSPGTVYALTQFDDGAGSALCAGGNYFETGQTPSAMLARWRCPCPHCDANGDDNVDLIDYLVFSNCMSGPSTAVGSKCLTVRLDAGPYIDLRDFAVLQNNFTGPSGH